MWINNDIYKLVISLINHKYVISFLLLNNIFSGKNGTKFWTLNNLKLINYFKNIKCSTFKEII